MKLTKSIDLLITESFTSMLKEIRAEPFLFLPAAADHSVCSDQIKLYLSILQIRTKMIMSTHELSSVQVAF